jgi:hypothetical protein
MMNHPDKESRVASGSHARYKAAAYCRTRAALFIESSQRQALEIAASSGRPVLCMESAEMVLPDAVASLRRGVRELPASIWRLPRRVAERRELVLWHAGKFMDRILPSPVMRAARRVKRVVAASSRSTSGVPAGVTSEAAAEAPSDE